ncbi:MAG: PAS domain S-box protein [Methanoregula sp.]|nr:PAS domain S-box protein [Methanoregula sp.]
MYSILYVDDDEILLDVNKIYLERKGEFSVDIANSALDALKMIPEQSYDAIVSDYDMPVMNGIGLLKEVRSRHGSIPFLLFTGKGREEVVIEAVDNGVDYYIQKGPDVHGMIAELIHKIKRSIERRRINNELVRSRQQMNDIINFLPDATFVLDKSGHVIAWNKALEKMTGIRREDMLGKGDQEYALPFYSEKLPLLADLVLEADPALDTRYLFFERTGDKITSEVFIPHFNSGTGANLWIAASPLYDAYGMVTGAIESLRDISDHYAVQRALNISREMVQGFADIIPVAIYEMDLNYILTFSNRVGYDLFGYTREDFENKISIIDFITSADQQRVINDLKNVIVGISGSGQEYLLIRKDKSTFPALIYGAKIVDPDTGKPAGVRGVIIDITERKKQAQELYESRERLSLAIKAGDLGIWDVDMRTMKIHDIYGWANHTLGYQPDDLAIITVNTCKSLVHILDLPRVLFAFFKHLSGKEPLFEAEFRLPCKNGNWKWVAVRGKVIERDANNQAVRITGTINAMTHPKK